MRASRNTSLHEDHEDDENAEIGVPVHAQNLNQLSEFKKIIDLEKFFLDTEVLLNEHLST